MLIWKKRKKRFLVIHFGRNFLSFVKNLLASYYCFCFQFSVKYPVRTSAHPCVCILKYLSCRVLLKNCQTYFKNVIVFTSQDFKSMFGHFSTCMKEINGWLLNWLSCPEMAFSTSVIDAKHSRAMFLLIYRENYLLKRCR